LAENLQSETTQVQVLDFGEEPIRGAREYMRGGIIIRFRKKGENIIIHGWRKKKTRDEGRLMRGGKFRRHSRVKLTLRRTGGDSRSENIGIPPGGIAHAGMVSPECLDVVTDVSRWGRPTQGTEIEEKDRLVKPGGRSKLGEKTRRNGGTRGKK